MSVFSELYAGILLALTIRHYTKEHLQLKTLAKIILASVIMATVLFAGKNLPVLLTIIIGAAVFVAALMAVGGFSRATLSEILSPKSL